MAGSYPRLCQCQKALLLTLSAEDVDVIVLGDQNLTVAMRLHKCL
jgi:hypothetical protein